MKLKLKLKNCLKNINTNSIDIESSKKYSNVNEVLTEIGLEEYIDKFTVEKKDLAIMV